VCLTPNPLLSKTEWNRIRRKAKPSFSPSPKNKGNETIAAAAIAGKCTMGRFTTATADRSEILHACPYGFTCRKLDCEKLHGKFEPKQNERLKQLKGLRGALGLVGCAFQLFGFCPHGVRCTCRHFTDLREVGFLVILSLRVDMNMNLDFVLCNS
jgi:hypothetical protein